MSSDFKLSQSPHRAAGDYSVRNNLIGITVIFISQFTGKVKVLVSLSAFLDLYSETAKYTIWQLLFFLLIITRSGILAEIR